MTSFPKKQLGIGYLEAESTHVQMNWKSGLLHVLSTGGRKSFGTDGMFEVKVSALTNLVFADLGTQLQVFFLISSFLHDIVVGC